VVVRSVQLAFETNDRFKKTYDLIFLRRFRDVAFLFFYVKDVGGFPSLSDKL